LPQSVVQADKTGSQSFQETPLVASSGRMNAVEASASCNPSNAAENTENPRMAEKASASRSEPSASLDNPAASAAATLQTESPNTDISPSHVDVSDGDGNGGGVIDGKFFFPSHFSPALVDLILKALHPDPALRASVKEIKEHPWTTGAAHAANISLDVIAELSLPSERISRGTPGSDQAVESGKKLAPSKEGHGPVTPGSRRVSTARPRDTRDDDGYMSAARAMLNRSATLPAPASDGNGADSHTAAADTQPRPWVPAKE